MGKLTKLALIIIALALLPIAIPVLALIVLAGAVVVYYAAVPVFLVACAILVMYLGHRGVKIRERRIREYYDELDPPIPDKSHGRNTDACYFSSSQSSS